MNKTELRDRIFKMVQYEPSHIHFTDFNVVANLLTEKLLEEKEELKKIQLNPDADFDYDPEEVKLDDLAVKEIKEYREFSKSFLRKQKTSESENLNAKKELVKQLDLLLRSSKSADQLRKRISEIQAEWKAVGPVPSKYRKEIRGAYHQLNDKYREFLLAHRELKGLDVQKSILARKKILETFKVILTEKDPELLEVKFDLLNNDWYSGNSLPKKEWESILIEYREITKKIHSKIRENQKIEIKRKQDLYLEKQKLLTELKSLSEVQESDLKEFEKNSLDYYRLKNNFYNLEQTFFKNERELKNELKSITEVFNLKKKKWFSGNHNSLDKAIETKQQLIDEMRSSLQGLLIISNDRELSQLTNSFIELKKAFVSASYTGKNRENKFWRSFKSLENQWSENIHKRKIEVREKEKLEFESFFESLEQLNKGTTAENVLSGLSELGSNVVLDVNLIENNKKRIISAVQSIFNQHAKDQNDLEVLMITGILKLTYQTEHIESFYQTEVSQINKSIESLTLEIARFENNLGFFANSSAALKLLNGADKEIEDKKILKASLQIKLKMYKQAIRMKQSENNKV